MSTPRSTKFTKEMQIPSATAVSRFGKAVASIMDYAGRSSSEKVQKLKETDLRWFVGYVRGEDPDTDDPEAFTRELAKTTIVKLAARLRGDGTSFTREADWDGPIPPQVMAELESHARRICASRKRAEEVEEPTDVFEPVTDHKHLIRELDKWVKEHPRHDKRVAYIAHAVLEHLIESGV